jgi:hypothetical protein
VCVGQSSGRGTRKFHFDPNPKRMMDIMDTKEPRMAPWKIEAQAEADLIFNEALASGETRAEAARLSKKHFGRMRGRAAARGEVSAIQEENLWVSKVRAAKDLAVRP